MADERIKIIVEQQGVTEAIHNLQDIKKLIGDTNRQKMSISVDTRDAIRGIEMIGKSLASAFDFSHSLAMKVGDTFSQMADLFNTNFTKIVEQEMVQLFTDLFTGNIKASLSRADIMNTFMPYMELAGVANDVAQEALNRVDLSIRGLPIGLDEAAQRLRRYQMFLGDTQYATDLTIGVQRAITAGGAPENFKTQAYYMIDRLLTAGNLSTSRQWYSLINGLGVSVRFLAEAMGVGSITSAELAAGLANGTYSAQQLLDAFVALGNGTASSSAQLEKALEIYKSTFQSWMENIKFASIRGGTNVINALDEVLESETGKKITGYMEDVRDGLNTIFSGIAEWVRGNSDTIIRVVDAVKGLFSALSGLGFGSIASGILNNFARLIEYITTLVERLSGSNVSEFIAFATTLAGPIGSFLTKAGSTLPIILGVFQRFKDFDFETLIDKIIHQVGNLANFIERILRIIPDGLLGDLMAFALVWGKPLVNIISGIGSSLKGVATFFSGLKNLVLFLATNPIGWAVDILAGIAGLAIYATQKYNAMVDSIIESRSVYADFTDVVNQAADAVESNIKSADRQIDSLDAQAEETKALVDELLQLNEVELNNDHDLFADTLNQEGTSLERMQEIIAQLNALYPDWNLAIDESTGKLTENSIAILENVDAMLAAAKLEAAQAAITTAYTDRYTLRANAKKQAENLQELRDQQAVYQREFERQLALNDTIQPGDTEEVRAYKSLKAWNAARGFTFADGTTLGAYLDAYERLIADAEKAEEANNKQLDANDELISDLNAIIREDQAVAQSFDELGLAAGNAATEIDASTTAIENHAYALEEAKEKYQELKEAAESAIESVLGGWGEFESPEAMAAKEMLEGINARQKYANTYAENLDVITQKILKDSDDLNLYRFISQALEGGIENAPELAAIVEAYRSGTLDAMVKAWTELELTKDQQAKRDAAVQTMVQNDINALEEAYAEEAQTRQTNAERSLEEAQRQNRIKEIQETGRKHQEEYDKQQRAIEALYAGLGEERAQAILDMEAQNAQVETVTSGNVEEQIDNLRRTNEDTLKNVIETTDKMSDAYENGKDRIGEASKNIIDSVNNIGDEIRDATDNNIVPAMDEMFTKMIDTVYNRGSALQEALRAFGESLRNITSSFFTGPVFGSLSSGSSSDGWGKSGGGSGRGFFNGGLVYAANGMFIPRGTDTVPAMLTPGEFVVNRRATQTIGASILAQINRLDIPGALHSLMHRIPAIGGGPVITNNSSRDNHASVTQNFYNSRDDGFAYRRANRFVRALV